MDFDQFYSLLSEHWGVAAWVLGASICAFLWGRRYERLRGILAYAPDPEFLPDQPHQGMPVLPSSQRGVIPSSNKPNR